MARFVRQADSQKWANFMHDPQVSVMTIADMDLPLFQPLKEAIVQRIRRVNNFTYKNVSEECYGKIIEWYQLRHLKKGRPSLAKEQIVETPSLLNIMYLLIDRMTLPQDGILLLTPVYNYYDKISKFLKRRVWESKLLREINRNEVRYQINFSDLAQKAKISKIMIFCNPHNPSGRIWTQQQVQKIVSICKQNNILIISDEILSDLIPSKHMEKFYSMANFSYPRIVICNSISKAFNAESLRAGYAIIRDESIRNIYKEIASNINLYNNQFGMMCTEICYSEVGLQWLDYSLSIIRDNYQYLLQKIKGTKLLVSQLEAAYIITINFDNYLIHITKWSSRQLKRVDAKHVVSFFLKEREIRGIQMIYGNEQGVLTDIRVTIAVEKDIFVKFADRLRAIVSEMELEDGNINAKL